MPERSTVHGVSQEGRHILPVLNRYVEGEYYESRRGQLMLARITVAISEERIGRVRRASIVEVRGGRAEIRAARDGQWLRAQLPVSGVHAMIVLEH